MGIKGLIGFGFVLLDLAIILIIIGLLGIKNFAMFSLFYIIGLFITSIFFRLFGMLDVEDWYSPNKVKYKRLTGVLIIILLGFIMAFLSKSSIGVKTSGTITGLFVVYYLAYWCRDFLYMLHGYMDIIDSMILKRFPRWLKK